MDKCFLSIEVRKYSLFVLFLFIIIIIIFDFSRQGFSVAFFLVLVLELAFVDQTGLELTEIHLPLPHEC